MPQSVAAHVYHHYLKYEFDKWELDVSCGFSQPKGSPKLTHESSSEADYRSHGVLKTKPHSAYTIRDPGATSWLRAGLRWILMDLASCGLQLETAESAIADGDARNR